VSVTTLQTCAPGFFAAQKYAASVHLDGTCVAPAGFFGSGVASRPAQPGETILLFGSGFGSATPAVPAGQMFSGAAANVSFAGMVAAGLHQVNIVVPSAAG
jgi:uncharacterized protein (TIGR03437 family)